jgi:Winged helix-turn helix/DDE superfamily endonuclease
VVRWRASDLIMRLHEEFGLSLPDDTIYRALKDLGFSHVSARQKAYKQDADAMAAFKETLPYAWRKSARHSPPGTPVEVWFQDEMRVGQKNKLTYRWARKGSGPLAIHDQRTQSTYLFGALCPERGAGAALVLPACNTEAMQLHLHEIATKVTPGAHAVLILDQAGWHGAPKTSRLPKHLAPAAAAACARSSTLKMAVYAGELAVEPHLQILRRNRRPGTLGTRSSISPGKSCPSLAAIGQSPVTHCEDWCKVEPTFNDD